MAPAALSLATDAGPSASSHRRFYPPQLRDSDSSPNPPSESLTHMSPLPSPLGSPRVNILPFGHAYRHVRVPSDESLQLSQLPPLPISPRWDSLSNSKFGLPAGSAYASMPGSPMEPPRPYTPFSYDVASNASGSRNPSPTPTFPLATKSSLADLRACDNPPPAAPAVENFSRPRKLSLRQPITDPARPRGTSNASPADQYLELVSSPQNPLWPPTRQRGPSTSSLQSSSTYASVLSPFGASDLADSNRLPRARTTNGAVASSNTRPPPLSYSASAIDSGRSASPSPVVAPWMSGEELRSSFRSQLTESTAPGTALTERSSVLTKDSSVTSLYPTAEGEGEVKADTDAGPDSNVSRPSDLEDDDLEEPSLEDVMGMYEQGFEDDEDAASDVFYDMEPRPDTAASELERQCATAFHTPLEDSFPQRQHSVSQRSVTEPSSTLAAEIRRSKMIFTSPAFTASVPHIAEGNYGRKSFEKRDSAKSLDSEPSIDSRLPPPITDTPPVSAPSSRPASRATTPAAPRSESPAMPRVDSPAASTAPAAVFMPTEPEDPDGRDRYGFKKENQYVTRKQYDAWNAKYTEYLARRRKKWVSYLKDNALMTDNPNRFPAPNAKTKRFIRKGIPPDWRGAAWFYYAGGPAILSKHSGLYDKLTNQRAKTIDAEAIERDLHRTFPDNIKFKMTSAAQEMAGSRLSDFSDDGLSRGSSPVPGASANEPPVITSLRRVLHAFSVYNPRIGYCQSLNFLAGLLLLFVPTEEQCFWLLNVITRIYLPGTHETNLEGSKVDLGVLMTELRESMPAVWDKIGGELEADPTSRPSTSRSLRMPRPRRKDTSRLSTDRLPPITMCMTAWFMSCFIGTLPIETTLRVWDVFFYEGSKTLFRIALAIFKQGEGEIKSVADPMEMFGVVQGMPRQMIDANALMEACFKRRNGFGHLSQDTIDERRQERRAKAHADRMKAQGQPQHTWTITKPDKPSKAEKPDKERRPKKGVVSGKTRTPMD